MAAQATGRTWYTPEMRLPVHNAGKIGGYRTFVAEYDADLMACTWYDPSQRLWTTYLCDAQATQTGDAEYGTSRAEAFRDMEYLIQRALGTISKA